MAELLYLVASIHILLCPFTKVEESFNIQGFHDILYHRHNLSLYDHNEFPGVVPRTFIGPLTISTLSAPVVGVLNLFGINKFWAQYVVRLTLAVIVILAWSRLRNTLMKHFGTTFAWWYTIITVTQYHFMFYMSRPLPNIMAMPLVLLAYEGWLSGNHLQYLVAAGFSMVIFRSELAMLFGLFLIIDLYFKKIDLRKLFKIVVPTGISLIALTVVVDGIFWRRLHWPEAEVFWFNTFMNKSSDWGTSPFLWYFYSALPRGLGPSLVLIPLGLYLDKRMLAVAAPAFVYIILFSILPHKELRFIIYVFPLLNMASAAACSYVFIRRKKSPIYELLFWGVVLSIIGNVILSFAFVSVAMTNYPGGEAILRFHKLMKDEPFVHVHIGNLAAQTGVTRFTEMNPNWKYSKNESLDAQQLMEFTHLLIEAKSKYSPNLKAFAETHAILDSIEGFSHVALNFKLIPPIRIKTKPTIFILERLDFKQPVKPQFCKDTSNLESVEAVDPEIYLEENVNSDENGKDSLHEADLDVNTNEIKVTIDTSDKVDENVELTSNDENIEFTPTIDENVEFTPTFDENLEFTTNIDESSNTENPANVEDEQFEAIDVKLIRKEKKQKAIEKIKSEARKHLAASAKEKLREIMKRRKNLVKVPSETIETEIDIDVQEENIELEPTDTYDNTESINDIPSSINDIPVSLNDIPDALSDVESETAHSDDDVNHIVEEVIARLIDRKMYDDKTKLEDIKTEDRQMIQLIVEEVIAERINYAKVVSEAT